MKKRCGWATNELLQKYHDKEWGVPLHQDRKLFEFLLLDGAQAGLSWSTILGRRKSYRKAFNSFNPKKISMYTASDISRLLRDNGIIRNGQKIKSAINNAKRFLEVVDEFGTFDKYIWSFVDYKTITNRYQKWKNVPPFSSESQNMSYDLKKRGFSFVGPTICYAFMQSAGMVNDHTTSCFRYHELKNGKKI
jgi:DNA-3-methyladenine glycosylase I